MLTLSRITKRFGGLTAVDDVSFTLGKTGISGLIGPNGSGKTTLFHLITGFYGLDKGCISFKDETISGLAPHIISQKGIVRTFQQTRVLPFLSVLDNLCAAVPGQAGERLFPLFFTPSKVARQEKQNQEKALSVLNTLNLTRMAGSPAGDLSYGQQKLLEIGRVLMADPKLIILDEPTAGINPSLIKSLVTVLKNLRDQNIKIFIIEHNIPLVSDLCSEVFVMDSGSLIFSGTPEQVRQDEQVIEAYLGKEA